MEEFISGNAAIDDLELIHHASLLAKCITHTNSTLTIRSRMNR